MLRREIAKNLFMAAAGGALASQPATAQVCSAPCYPQTAFEAARGVTPTNTAFPPFNVWRYGADPSGTADSRSAIQTAINLAQAAFALTPYGDAGPVFIPRGTYRIDATSSPDSLGNGLVVPYTAPNLTLQRVRIVGEGRSTVLRANTANMIVIRFCDSHGGVENLTIDGAGLANVHGLAVVPESRAQTGSLVYQLYNRFENLYVHSCTEGLVLQCGPRVGGADSGCWYNEFSCMHIFACRRGIWLASPPNFSSGVNRNWFVDVRIGQQCNTGVQIDSGGTNNFQIALEGVEMGTSPNLTPTALKIAAADAFGTANESNRFWGVTFEGNTRDIDNASPYTELHGCYYSGSKIQFTALPAISSGYHGSEIPQIAPGMIYQGNGQIPGRPNNTLCVTAENGLQTTSLELLGKRVNTGPGGSGIQHSFPLAYVPGGLYLISRGAVDSAGTSYLHRVSPIFETASGTFVEGSRLLDATAGGASIAADSVTRAPTGNLLVTVGATKPGAIFTTYASVVKLA
jgi:hypothetical protein